MRSSLALGEEPVVVGIGRLVKQKNWPVFIAAASRIDGACFAIAGDGPLREELAMLARDCGNRVLFLGVIEDIAALIGLAACVVTTSAWEGLPLTVLEALSLGTPVVATAVDGVIDVVPPTAALLVPADDPGAVSQAVSRILTDGDLAADLRREALAAAPAWGPARMLGMYQKAYEAARTGEPRWA
jgi:glycosyltransferase involved in cell wall biosynthesis